MLSFSFSYFIPFAKKGIISSFVSSDFVDFSPFFFFYFGFVPDLCFLSTFSTLSIRISSPISSISRFPFYMSIFIIVLWSFSRFL